jgi:hypothetical protein
MEAMIGRARDAGFEPAAVEWLKAMAEWLKATRRLARSALQVTGYVLVNTSRAGLLTRASGRRRRRFIGRAG